MRFWSDHGFSVDRMSLRKIGASKSGYGSIFGAKKRPIVFSQNPCAPLPPSLGPVVGCGLYVFRASPKSQAPHRQSLGR